MKAMIVDGIVQYVSPTVGNANISEDEYNAILKAINNMPTPPDGYTYKLRADTLEWELVELPPVEPEPLTEEDALTRYANELTGSNDQTLLDAAETLITERIKEDM